MHTQILNDVAAIEAKGFNNVTPEDLEDLINQCKLLVVQHATKEKEIKEYRMTLRELQPFVDLQQQNMIRTVLK